MTIATVEPWGSRWRVTLLTFGDDGEARTTLTVQDCGEAWAIANGFTGYAAEAYAERSFEAQARALQAVSHASHTPS